MAHLRYFSINLLCCTLIIYSFFYSCIPIIHTRSVANFRNGTVDTLIIGASHCDNIDSMENLLWPRYRIANSDLKATDSISWNGYDLNKYVIYPDSICGIDTDYLFFDTDTCYFFLIKWGDARILSWDEIRQKKLYRKRIIVRDCDGKFKQTIM